MKILLADADRELVGVLGYWLRNHGFDIQSSFDGEQAITRWRQGKPDLLLLDFELPKINSCDVCRLVASESTTRIFFLSERKSVEDEIKALDLGADVFLHKPFSPAQVLAHIRALQRRTMGTASPRSAAATGITVGPITLDAIRHEVRCGDRTIRLTPIESRLLHLLLSNSGQVITPNVILERVWGYDDLSDSTLIKTHIRHLRQKVELEPGMPQHIVTIPHVGYQFIANDMHELLVRAVCEDRPPA